VGFASFSFFGLVGCAHNFTLLRVLFYIKIAKKQARGGGLPKERE